MTPSPARITAVVVTFHPDVDALDRLVKALAPQVHAIVVVDNTPSGAGGARSDLANTEVVRLGVNRGLAGGLNRGCEWALRNGAAFALMFDQDSVPAGDMVERLCEAWRDAATKNWRIAAAGPQFEDERGGHPPSFLRVGFPRNRPVEASPSDTFVETDVLITSGCLVSLAAYADAGGMDETLFIDNVDIEWGFRARAAGWRLIGAPHARLAHRIGDDHVPAPAWLHWLRRKQIIRHGPARLYYIMRNRVLLYWMPHVPMAWKAQDFLRLPGKLVLSVSVAGERWASARALMRGLLHGLTGRRGPIA